MTKRVAVRCSAFRLDPVFGSEQDAPDMESLTLNNLVLPKEKTYYSILLIVSIIGWLAIAITIVGLFYGALFSLVFWFAHGLLIAHLRSEGVKVSESQLPRLHATFLSVCEQLELPETPELYVIQSGGILNAFATRFSGRDFVVVYSEMLEAHGEESSRIRFILGHEIGHIKRSHVFKKLLLLPGKIIPLLGPAYNRACEATCDRHGAFACGDIDGGIQAMMALSGGKSAGLCMNADAFAAQYRADRGFFVSLHELTSGYPTLSQRVANLMALRDGTPTPRASRNPLAFFFALFLMPGNAATAASPMLAIAMIAMLAAIAVPNFLRARQRSQATVTLNQLRLLDRAIDQYAIEHKKDSEIPLTFNDLKPYLPSSFPRTPVDILGHPYGPFIINHYPRVNPSTYNALSDVAPEEFWSPFK